jgi:hypothetical protein
MNEQWADFEEYSLKLAELFVLFLVKHGKINYFRSNLSSES